MSFYVGQSLLTISLDTKYDISTASVTKIIYKKPDATVGDWDGTISGTKIEYQVDNEDIDLPGKWEFQSYIEIAGKKAYGDKVIIEFLQIIN